eukprot:UN03053
MKAGIVCEFLQCSIPIFVRTRVSIYDGCENLENDGSIKLPDLLHSFLVSSLLTVLDKSL